MKKLRGRAVYKLQIRYVAPSIGELSATVEKTNLALSLMHLADGWASVLTLPGVLLARGFLSKVEAHQFNERVSDHDKLSPGEPTLAQFIAASGGEAAARAAVEACRGKAR